MKKYKIITAVMALSLVAGCVGVSPNGADAASGPKFPVKTLEMDTNDSLVVTIKGVKPKQIKKLSVSSSNKKIVKIKGYKKKGVVGLTSGKNTGKATVKASVRVNKKNYKLKIKVSVTTDRADLKNVLSSNSFNKWNMSEEDGTLKVLKRSIIDSRTTGNKTVKMQQAYINVESGLAIFRVFKDAVMMMPEGFSYQDCVVNAGSYEKKEDGTYDPIYAYYYFAMENGSFTNFKKYLLGPNDEGEAGNAAYLMANDIKAIYISGDGEGVCPYLDESFIPEDPGLITVTDGDDGCRIFKYSMADFETITLHVFGEGDILDGYIHKIEVAMTDGSYTESYDFDYEINPKYSPSDAAAMALSADKLLSEEKTVRDQIFGNDKKLSIDYELNAEGGTKRTGSYTESAGGDVTFRGWFPNYPTGEFYTVNKDGSLTPLVSLEAEAVMGYLNPESASEPVKLVWKDTSVG
ncbi:MAG: hypothetical protein J6P16_01455 [Eubacterium sp.]|nr:hypothetical protein [Eubacterium sp.]